MYDKISQWASEIMSLTQDTQICRIAENIKNTAADLAEAGSAGKSYEVYLDIIHKLAQEYFRIFYVNVHDSSYTSYDPYSDERAMNMDEILPDFFLESDSNIFDTLYEEDRERFMKDFQKDRFIGSVIRDGEYSILYRVVDKGKLVFVTMKGIRMDNDPDHIIVGVKNIDTQFRREKTLINKLELAMTEASIDALTGVKNKHAFIDYEAELKHLIEEKEISDFAILVFDANNLKTVNDVYGHQAGDRYIKEAGKLICNCFKRSPVFRIGGDEFAVIASGYDYDHIDEHLSYIDKSNAQNLTEECAVVVAAGMARYRGNESIEAVFDRADANMYENKKRLKSGTDEAMVYDCE